MPKLTISVNIYLSLSHHQSLGAQFGGLGKMQHELAMKLKISFHWVKVMLLPRAIELGRPNAARADLEMPAAG